jgi:predicted  nucleic acid-binding Zn-ribbon protein
MTSANETSSNASAEIDRLVGELEKAEAYEQRLRQVIIDVRDQLASGRVEVALSMLNQALNFIDDQTDVVAQHGPRP